MILRKLGDLIAEKKDYLATLDSYDMGKPLREALADIGDAITACGHFADLAEAQDGHQNEDINNGSGGDFTTKIFYEPLGVIGAITPWNYPFLMGIWKIVPAIAAGCTIVLKPSELAPLSCLAFGDLVNAAGLPAGALNIVVSNLSPIFQKIPSFNHFLFLLYSPVLVQMRVLHLLNTTESIKWLSPDQCQLPARSC